MKNFNSRSEGWSFSTFVENFVGATKLPANMLTAAAFVLAGVFTVNTAQAFDSTVTGVSSRKGSAKQNGEIERRAYSKMAGSATQSVSAQQLPAPRKTIRIEAEACLAISSEADAFELKDSASSGGSCLAVAGGASFDLQVDVPQLLRYQISLVGATPYGTSIEVQLISETRKITLAKTLMPVTGSWKDYQATDELSIALPAGRHTLRFRNRGKGLKVDYVTFSAGTLDDVDVERLAMNDGPDINPLKGFNTGWWRDDDYASVGFQYIEWGRFEPNDDEFDWDYVENHVLNRAGTSGRHFILQFCVDWDNWDARQPSGDSHYKGPSWLMERVGENRGPAFPDQPNSRISRATRYNHPQFIAEASEAIKALLDHYRDDPRTFVIQVGVLGYWGEWHTFPRTDWGPNDQTKKAILDSYMDNLGVDGLTQVRYPDEPVNHPRQRMGYTNGSVTPTPHGYDFGKAIAAGELWRNGPVGGEWPPSVEHKYWKNFFETSEGKRFLTQGGYSTVMVPEAKEIAAELPGWKKDERFMEMHRSLGYKFCVDTVRHLHSSDASHGTHFEIELSNRGIAPFYKDWQVQMALIDAETQREVDVIDLETDLRDLGPSETTTLAASSDAFLDPQKTYQLAIRMIQPQADEKKPAAWKLDARNTYIVLANEIDVMPGVWNDYNALQGGWNVLQRLAR